MNKLYLSEQARSDLDEIKRYIARELENPTAAATTIRKITKDIRRLREYAMLGAALSSISTVESDYRVLVTGNYLTFYRVYGSEIYVDRILYGRRDYLRILLGPITKDKTRE